MLQRVRFEFDVATPAKVGSLGSKTILTALHPTKWFSMIGILAVLASPFAAAEEKLAPYEEAVQVPLLAAVTWSPKAGESDLWSAASLGVAAPTLSFVQIDLWHMDGFLRRLARWGETVLEPSAILAPMRMPSRYSYESKGKFHAGFGSIFADDTIGHSRANGAGIQDAQCFYLKMSFRF